MSEATPATVQIAARATLPEPRSSAPAPAAPPSPAPAGHGASLDAAGASGLPLGDARFAAADIVLVGDAVQVTFPDGSRLVADDLAASPEGSRLLRVLHEGETVKGAAVLKALGELPTGLPDWVGEPGRVDPAAVGASPPALEPGAGAEPGAAPTAPPAAGAASAGGGAGFTAYEPGSMGAGLAPTGNLVAGAASAGLGAGSAPAALEIEGAGLRNLAPVAGLDRLEASEDEPLRLDLLANDHDPDGPPSQLQIIKLDTHGLVGEVHVGDGGVLVYDPAGRFEHLKAGESVLERFAYEVADGRGGVARGKVEITVQGVNDAPVASGEHAVTAEDTPLSLRAADLLANDTDVEGDALAIVGVENARHGVAVLNADGTIGFAPEKDFNGTGSFDYVVSDGHGGFATATVTIEVTPVNDAPVATDNSRWTREDTPLTLAKGDLVHDDTDVDGDPLVVSAVGNAVHGSVVLNADGTITFTPDPNYNGTGHFDYTASDGQGGTATAHVRVNIAPVNDDPWATPDHLTGMEDTALVIRPEQLLANDTDIDGDTLHIAGVAHANHGTAVLNADGTITFTPDPDFNGTASFVYHLSDGHDGNAAAGVWIEVAPVNDAPVVVEDTLATDEDTPLTFDSMDLVANDYDIESDPMRVIGVGDASHGQVTLAEDGTITFTPDPDFNGTASFSYTIGDGNGGTGTGTARVVVAPVNDAPVAVDDTLETDEDTVLTIDAARLLANDSDVDGDPLTLVGVGEAVNGRVELIQDGTITFTPDPDFNGIGSFTYSIEDGQGGTATGIARVIVAPVNDAPVAMPDLSDLGLPHVEEDGVLYLDPAQLTANDSDVDGDPLTVSAIGHVVGGTVEIDPDGLVVVRPKPDWNGAVTFSYTVSDGQGGTAESFAIVRIDPVNDAPRDIGLLGGAVHEGEAGAVVGRVTFVDPDLGDAHSFSVDDPRFTIDADGILRLKDGVALDRTAGDAITLDVTVSDDAGLGQLLGDPFLEGMPPEEAAELLSLLGLGGWIESLQAQQQSTTQTLTVRIGAPGEPLDALASGDPRLLDHGQLRLPVAESSAGLLPEDVPGTRGTGHGEPLPGRGGSGAGEGGDDEEDVTDDEDGDDGWDALLAMGDDDEEDLAGDDGDDGLADDGEGQDDRNLVLAEDDAGDDEDVADDEDGDDGWDALLAMGGDDEEEVADDEDVADVADDENLAGDDGGDGLADDEDDEQLPDDQDAEDLAGDEGLAGDEDDPADAGSMPFAADDPEDSTTPSDTLAHTVGDDGGADPSAGDLSAADADAEPSSDTDTDTDTETDTDTDTGSDQHDPTDGAPVDVADAEPTTAAGDPDADDLPDQGSGLEHGDPTSVGLDDGGSGDGEAGDGGLDGVPSAGPDDGGPGDVPHGSTGDDGLAAADPEPDDGGTEAASSPSDDLDAPDLAQLDILDSDATSLTTGKDASDGDAAGDRLAIDETGDDGPIADFQADAGGDALDLRDLLSGPADETGAALQSFLRLEVVDGDTRVVVDVEAGEGAAADAPDGSDGSDAAGAVGPGPADLIDHLVAQGSPDAH